MAHANRRGGEQFVGVPQTGDPLGQGFVEIGDYAVARMAPAEFERLIASVRNAESAEASAGHPSPGQGRTMSDQAGHEGASPTGPTS
jgi:hypothetical protein